MTIRSADNVECHKSGGGPFTLGSVQIGQPYGLGRSRQQVLGEDQATALLDAAAGAGLFWVARRALMALRRKH